MHSSVARSCDSSGLLFERFPCVSSIIVASGGFPLVFSSLLPGRSVVGHVTVPFTLKQPSSSASCGLMANAIGAEKATTNKAVMAHIVIFLIIFLLFLCWPLLFSKY